MDLTRRRVLVGLIAAPLIVSTPGLLMPVRGVLVRPPVWVWADDGPWLESPHTLGFGRNLAFALGWLEPAPLTPTLT